MKSESFQQTRCSINKIEHARRELCLCYLKYIIIREYQISFIIIPCTVSRSWAWLFKCSTLDFISFYSTQFHLTLRLISLAIYTIKRFFSVLLVGKKTCKFAKQCGVVSLQRVKERFHLGRLMPPWSRNRLKRYSLTGQLMLSTNSWHGCRLPFSWNIETRFTCSMV